MSNQDKARNGGSSGKQRTSMTKDDSARINSATAKAHDGRIPARSFASRADSAAQKNESK